MEKERRAIEAGNGDGSVKNFLHVSLSSSNGPVKIYYARKKQSPSRKALSVALRLIARFLDAFSWNVASTSLHAGKGDRAQCFKMELLTSSRM